MKGHGSPIATDTGFVENSVGYENLTLTVEGWYSEAENEGGRERKEVSLKFKASPSVGEEFTLVTSVDASRARKLGEQLIEAAAIADGKMKPQADGNDE